MKVLSIRQPYAWLIAIGCKTIENRIESSVVVSLFMLAKPNPKNLTDGRRAQ